MLIPYDNNVIPVPKELRRSFADDEPSRRETDAPSHSRPTETSISGADDGGRAGTSDADDASRNRHSTPPPGEASQFAKQGSGVVLPIQALHDLRLLTEKLNPGDVKFALENYTAFNDYFYRPQRDHFDGPETVFRDLPQKKLFKADPLAADPRRGNQNPLFSVAKSIKLVEPHARVTVVEEPKGPSQLPVPETLLADARVNLRWGELSCWDFMLKKDEEDMADISDGPGIEEPPFRWVIHAEFNVDAAMENLREFFRTKWPRGAHWRVHIELHTRKFKPGAVTGYVFETCWSIPTRKQPVATATGSIFFIMDVCGNKKPEAPVIVSCHYENSPMIFDPLKIKFGADVLTDIMERKRLLAERLID